MRRTGIRTTGSLWRHAWLAAPLIAATAAQAQVSPQLCGPIAEPGQFGPYDYRTDKYFLPVVDNRHFTARIEALINVRGQYPYGVDINYTLQRFPNHYRALMSVLRISERKIPESVHGMTRPLECYFERALRWRPDDPVPRLIYARFLGQQKRMDEARGMLEATARSAGDNVLTNRNIGLIYLELGMVDKALAQAYFVLQLDPAEVVLKEELTRRGLWREPTAAEQAEAASRRPKTPAAAASASAASASASASASAGAAAAPASEPAR